MNRKNVRARMVVDVRVSGEMHAELRGVYAVWLREVKRYLRDKMRLITAVTAPIVWLLLFGVGFSSFFRQSGGINYINFLFPGIIAQSLLFTSVFLGISVIYDRQFGFLKEMLVAPIKRVSVFSGKMLGGATDALIQASIVLVLSVFFIPVQPAMMLACLPIMLLTTIGFVSMSIIIASRLKTLESFGLIMNFVNLPLFFSSGALFPISSAPGWLQTLGYFNPLTYAVDAMRGLLLGHTVIAFSQTTFLYDAIRSLLLGNNLFPIWFDLAVLGGFAGIMILLGAVAFARR
ncbi:MAG: ABC transporter permease [Candidatus Jordarchaeaceae archaeon]